MTVGIIGSGGIGQALAAQFVKADLDVAISNSRGLESLAALVKKLGPHTKAVTVRVREAASADREALGTLLSS
jgi:hypothetical protein